MSEESGFGMMIPSDIDRWPDGTPRLFVQPEEKIKFVVWLSNKNIDASIIEGRELETFFKLWKKYWSK